MSRLLKAALCAAGTLLFTSPAAAAYVRYDFYTSGSGQFAFGAVRDQVFTFIVGNTSNGNVTAFPTPSTFVAFGPGGYYGFTDSRVVTGLAGVSGSATFGNGQSPTFSGNVTASACFDNASGAAFPQRSFDVLTTCGGGVSLQQQGSGSGGAYSGSVVRLVATAFEGASPSVGFTGFASAVPEPSTWALMLAGFGMVSYSLRRRRVRHQAVTLAA